MDGVAALKSALPSIRHAEVFFDSLVNRLGPGAQVEPGDEGAPRSISLGDAQRPDWVVPESLVLLVRGRRLVHVSDGESPPSDAPPPGRWERASRLRNLEGGEIQITLGGDSVSLVYGDDGFVAETCRSADFESILAAKEWLERSAANGAESLAEFVGAHAAQWAGPARVHIPAGSRRSKSPCWHAALRAIRCAAAEGKLPAAGFVAADGIVGSVMEWGPDWAQVVRRCRERIFRERPQSPPPSPPPSPEDLARYEAAGFSFLQFAPSERAPEPEEPATTPLAMVALRPCPSEGPPFGTWQRLLDDRGNQDFVARYTDSRGTLFVPKDVGESFGTADAVHRFLDSADQRAAGHWPTPDKEDRPSWLPPLLSSTRRYTLNTDGGVPTARLVGEASGPCFDAGSIRLEDIRGGLMRQRWLDGGKSAGEAHA